MLRSRSPENSSTFFQCERRLVLSAQLLFDVLGDHAIQNHVSAPVVGLGGEMVSTGGQALESHVASAHQLTGWDKAVDQFGLTGRGQTVAVIDSGIAWDHVALGKGYGAGYRVVGGWDFAENDANPYDDGPAGFHGTHVAGIIGNDDATRTGVASDVDFVALRVFDDRGQSQTAWVEKALQWVSDHRDSFENPITTVNLSLGAQWNSNTIPSWAAFEDELRQLNQAGIVITVSAGNSFKQYNAPGLSYPAASEYVLPVASVDDNGQLSDFSQRSERVIAAPGRSIVSTVPDYFLGRDGKANDFSVLSGTSMAAPYVAGASVLVRQAMEMAGWTNITASSIAEHLRATSDEVFDAITKAHYDRLDLQQALDAILPDDAVGDLSANAGGLNLSTGKLDGWINTTQDRDVYRFTASTSGKLLFDADSAWLDSLQWSLTTQGQAVADGQFDPESISLVAGKTYELTIDADREVGTYGLKWSFQADQPTPTPTPQPTPTPTPQPPMPVTNLGEVEYVQSQVAAGGVFRAQATQDGLFSVLWSNPDAASGQLSVISSGNRWTDSTWENGALRIDLQATAGQWVEIQTPGLASDQADMTLANLVSLKGRDLHVQGTTNSDSFEIHLDTPNQIQLNVGRVEYQFAQTNVASIQIEGGGAADKLAIWGSDGAEDIYLRPTGSNMETRSGLSLTANRVEQIEFYSGGGADGAYLYDSDGNDTLVARPRQVDMQGSDYRFIVNNVGRLYVHANAGGQDIGYFYDSEGDDRLSIRPQFSSMSGQGYFNFIAGIERVYAYASAGGHDTAEIYDSAGDDRFAASGDTASTSGSGFNSYTKGFEHVTAYATAGGRDIASLYGSTQNVEWLRGADFVSFETPSHYREARGFEKFENFADGQPLDNSVFSQNVGLTQTQSVAPYPQGIPDINNASEPPAGQQAPSDRNDSLAPGQSTSLLASPPADAVTSAVTSSVVDSSQWLPQLEHHADSQSFIGSTTKLLEKMETAQTYDETPWNGSRGAKSDFTPSRWIDNAVCLAADDKQIDLESLMPVIDPLSEKRTLDALFAAYQPLVDPTHR